MNLPRLKAPDRDAVFLTYSTWRGSNHSDDDVIIVRNLKRSYMDLKDFKKPFLGFRLTRDEEREP